MDHAAAVKRGVPVWVMCFAFGSAFAKRAWQRKRAFLPAMALLIYGMHATWNAIGIPGGWVETRGYVLATQARQSHNPFKNVVVRYETAEGRKIDFLDGNALTYLERGPEAASDVPVAYDPSHPRQAVLVADGRWEGPAKILLAGLAAVAAALFFPSRRRR